MFCLVGGFLLFFFWFPFWAIPLGMWSLSSLTRDGAHSPCSGSVESQPLDCPGNSGKKYVLDTETGTESPASDLTRLLRG